MTRFAIAIAALVFLSAPAVALDMKNKASFYGSIADEYNFSAVRVGYHNWEAGIITGSGIFSLGFIKNFSISRYGYAGLGFGLINGDHSTAKAYGSLIGAVGAECPLLSWLTARVEMVGIGQWQGMGYGGVLLGIRVHTL